MNDNNAEDDPTEASDDDWRPIRRTILASIGGVALGLGPVGLSQVSGQTGDGMATLEIHGLSGYEDYEFTVSNDGTIEPYRGIGGGDEVLDGGTRAVGKVGAGNVDVWAFTPGTLTDFHANTPFRTVLNGVEVKQGNLGDRYDGSENLGGGDGGTGDGADEWRTFVVEGTGSRADYWITVTGEIRPWDDGPGGINGRDEHEGNTATGYVGGGADPYEFTGDLVSVDVDGDANLYLDGEPYSADGGGGGGSPTEHQLVFAGDGTRGDYAFSVSGEIRETSRLGGTDRLGADRMDAEGRVFGGSDSYTFVGDITAFSADSNVTVTLDGEPYPDGDGGGGSGGSTDGQILVFFDDYPMSQHEGTVNSILDNRDIPATVGVITERLDRDSEFENLRDRKGRGWAIGSHTHTHTKLTTLSDSGVRRELRRSKAILADAGLLTDPPVIQYAKGGISDRVVDIARDYYNWGFGGRENEMPNYDDPMWIGRTKGHEQQATLDAIADAGDRGVTRALVYHLVTDSPQKNHHTSISDFREAMNAIRDAPNVEPITTQEYARQVA